LAKPATERAPAARAARIRADLLAHGPLVDTLIVPVS